MADHTAGIAWREWNDEAFAEARAQDKLILLDIGAVWCHWCHVMDTGIPGSPDHPGTYNHPEIQRRIAENFIPIKVDNDRRPDINARYNMGGWPTTAFLTPDGETLYGETYVPPARMASLLDYMTDIWRNRRHEVADQIAQMRAQRAAETQVNTAADLDPETVPTVLKAIKANFDPIYGGFGSQPKFPHPDALRLTLEQYALTNDPELREIALKTLHGMADGGMYDQFAGGFFRYSTTRDWSIPHFEKMLEDNAKLTTFYALASQILNDDSLLDIVRSAHNWLLSDMRDPETGTFAGSQDADKEEEYYGQPLSVRATMPTPYIDRTVYTGWNALMVSSLVARYEITGEPDILAQAKQTFAFIYPEGFIDIAEAYGLHFPHCYVNGKPQDIYILSDQTAMVHAALDLYEATAEAKYRKFAGHAGIGLASFEDTETGGYTDATLQINPIGELARPKKEIGDNADAALALIRLSALTEDIRYREAVERALKCFAEEYARLSYFAASYARAVEAALRPSLHLVIVGEAADNNTRALQQAAWAIIAPGKAVETLAISEGAQRGYPAGKDGTARAYVCIGTVCLAPVETPEALRNQVREALAYPAS